MHPLLLNVIAALGKYLATALTSKMGRNIRMLVENFAGDDYYLREAATFPRMIPESINDTLDGN